MPVLSHTERLGLPERHVAQAADDAWSAELHRVFGKRAGDMRYRPAGKGEEGSELRRLYEAREAARIAYDRASGLDEHGRPIPSPGHRVDAGTGRQHPLSDADWPKN